MKFSGESQKARRVQQRRIQKKNTALQCMAVSLLVAPPAPLPGWGSLSLLPVHSPPIFVLLLQQAWRQSYSMLNDSGIPSLQSSHLFVLQSLGGGANTIAITIPVIKVKLPLLNPQPSPFFATQRHCLHRLMDNN